jgi:hypothetical protein
MQSVNSLNWRRGASSKATYEHALDLGAAICPELLGDDVSLIKRSRETDLVREYRQRAEAKTRQHGEPISALTLLDADILELKSLIGVARRTSGSDKLKTDKLKKRLKLLEAARLKLVTQRHSETELIFRGAYNVDRNLPSLGFGRRHRDFELPDNNVLRVRVFHPDKPEQISGADITYERYFRSGVNIVAIQYKIWEEQRLPLNEQRTMSQLDRLKRFTCENKLCESEVTDRHYRFPFCAAFLRPTDRLQSPDQALMSSGEHLPICEIEKCTELSKKGTPYLSYQSIASVSLDQGVFEDLFRRGKIGSRSLKFAELEDLYRTIDAITENDDLVIHAQDFSR